MGTDYRSTSRQLSWLQEMGQGLSTATLGHTAQARTPCAAHQDQGSSSFPATQRQLPPQTTLSHHNFLAKTLGSPEGQWKFIYLFFVLSVFPQVAFPCKMPDMTPEGNLGVGRAPQGAAQGLKYKLEGRAQVGQARDSTRDMASQVEIKGLFFCRKKLCQRQGASILGGRELSGEAPPPWVAPTFPEK